MQDKTVDKVVDKLIKPKSEKTELVKIKLNMTTIINGKTHKPDEIVEVEKPLADDLIKDRYVSHFNFSGERIGDQSRYITHRASLVS